MSFKLIAGKFQEEKAENDVFVFCWFNRPTKFVCAFPQCFFHAYLLFRFSSLGHNVSPFCLLTLVSCILIYFVMLLQLKSCILYLYCLVYHFHTNLARLYEYFSIFVFVNKRRLGCIPQSPINDIIKF